MYDLIVIGGGPAGTSAAITAARQGALVLLLEGGRLPRHKVCGEFISAESLGLLESLLDPPHANLTCRATKIPKARFYVDDLVLKIPVHPPAVSITRLMLDVSLWNSAQTCGVTALQHVPVREVVGCNPFRVKTEIGDFDARAVINASGRWSNLNVRRNVDERSEARWLGLKAYYAEVSAEASADLFFFEDSYCGAQPIEVTTNGSAHSVNVCAMVRVGIATTLEQVFDRHPILRERTRHWTRITDLITTSPLIFHGPELVNCGMLQAGDAATFVDPFIGDGISLALRSGALAAECLEPFFKQKSSLQQATAAYCEEYERKLGHVFQWSSRIRRLFLSPSILRKPALSLLKRAPAITSLLVRMTR